MKKLLALLLLSLFAALAHAGDQSVMVDWKGTPYKARILKSEGGRHYVHYEGWPASYDEWIMDSQIISPKGRTAGTVPAARQPAPASQQAAERRVWVLWHGKPYEAVIIKSEGDRHFVRYPGWPSNYDEWIAASQIISKETARQLAAKQGAGSGGAAQQHGYQAQDKMREDANRLHGETMQQYRDTERHYENKRLYGN